MTTAEPPRDELDELLDPHASIQRDAGVWSALRQSQLIAGPSERLRARHLGRILTATHIQHAEPAAVSADPRRRWSARARRLAAAVSVKLHGHLLAADVPVGGSRCAHGNVRPHTDWRSSHSIQEETLKSSFRSSRVLRRGLAFTAASAMVIALVPAGTAAALDARPIDDVCPPPDGDESTTFTDIGGTEHERSIICADNYDIVNGKTTTTFDPNDGLTRAQMAAVITRFVQTATGDELAEGDDAFPDDDGSEHEDDIDKLAEANIVEGVVAGEYRPNAIVSRAQMATFIKRGVDFVDDGDARNASAFPDADDQDQFDDVAEGSRHEDNIYRLENQGIVEGKSETQYEPGEAVSRGQSTTFVMRAADYLDALNLWEPTAEADRDPQTFDVDLSWINENSDAVDSEGSDADTQFRQGEPGAEGTATITVDESDNSIDFDLDYSEVDGPFDDAPGFHVHEGAIDENGPIVVTLADGEELEADEDGMIDGSVDVSVGDFDVSDILDDVDDYYLNVHSNDFPAGAIRGQLPDGGQDQIPAQDGLRPVAYVNPDTGMDTENDDVDAGSSCTTPDQSDDQAVGSTNVHVDACLFDGDRDKVSRQASFEVEGVGEIFACPDPDGDGPEFSMQNDGVCTLSSFEDDNQEFHIRLLSNETGTQTVTFCEDADRDGCADADRTSVVTIEWVDGDRVQFEAVLDVAQDNAFTGRDQVTVAYTDEVDVTAGEGEAAEQFTLNGTTAIALGRNFQGDEQLRVQFPGDTVNEGDNELVYTESEDDESARVTDTGGFDALSPDTITFDVDTTAPEFTSSDPDEGDADVAVDVSPSATFGEDLDSGSATLSCDGTDVDGESTVDGDTIIFDPTDDLDNEANCTATFSAADAAENETVTAVNFTTVAAVANLESAVATAADVSDFGGTEGDSLALTFDGPLGDDSSATSVDFADADLIPCNSGNVTCNVVDSTLTVTASTAFDTSRDLTSTQVIEVADLDDANGNPVTVDSPVDVTTS